MEQRILYKYNLLIPLKAIKFNQPPYLSSVIRSSSITRGNRLSVPMHIYRPSRQIGRRSFDVAAPVEWTKLPQIVRSQDTIRDFRCQPQKYLFRLSYPKAERGAENADPVISLVRSEFEIEYSKNIAYHTKIFTKGYSFRNKHTYTAIK